MWQLCITYNICAASRTDILQFYGYRQQACCMFWLSLTFKSQAVWSHFIDFRILLCILTIQTFRLFKCAVWSRFVDFESLLCVLVIQTFRLFKYAVWSCFVFLKPAMWSHFFQATGIQGWLGLVIDICSLQWARWFGPIDLEFRLVFWL